MGRETDRPTNTQIHRQSIKTTIVIIMPANSTISVIFITEVVSAFVMVRIFFFFVVSYFHHSVNHVKRLKWAFNYNVRILLMPLQRGKATYPANMLASLPLLPLRKVEQRPKKYHNSQTCRVFVISGDQYWDFPKVVRPCDLLARLLLHVSLSCEQKR